jgi:uncharacterized integral membrane protein (TIGR00698 family)
VTTGATTPESRPERPARRRLAAVLVVLASVASLVPGVPAAAALAAGVFVALTVGNPFPARTRAVAKKLLPAAVVGLGGAMDLGAVARAGAHGFGYTAVSIAVVMAVGVALARALSVERRTGLLVTVGTAICGGSAIAAAAPVIGADDREISVSLATVFVLNSVALLVFPAFGHAAGLEPPAFGLWAALAIHDTSSVVGAAMQYGPAALAVATTIKLARALWIVPVTLALGVVERRLGGTAGRRGGSPPWFILGFIGAAALASYVPGLRAPGLVLASAARSGLVLTLFLIGLGLSRDGLTQVGPRPLVQGALLWLATGVATLVAVKLGLAAV